MASNSPTVSVTGQPGTSGSATDPIVAYIVLYRAEEWSERVSLLDGSPPQDDDWGSLGGYRSLSLAQDVGIEWALKQLQDRLERQYPPLETEEDRDIAFDGWDKSESTEGDCWLYTISKGKETLFTQVQRICL